MSPDPNPLKMSLGKANEINAGECKATDCSENQFRTSKSNENGGQQTLINSINSTEDAINKTLPLFVGRERRNFSPATINLPDTFVDPQSPSSSSSTSQTTSANDATFEPTIEMMVNDFDDEQTLNEEEALAAQELQDPDEEISTLKEESEMPLEELLAKYSALPPHSSTFSEPLQKKSKKTTYKKGKVKSKQKLAMAQSPKTLNEEFIEDSNDIVTDTSKHAKVNSQLMTSENKIIKDLPNDKKFDNYDEEGANSRLSTPRLPTPSANDEQKDGDAVISDNGLVHGEILKVRRSHLLDLYPEGTFDNVVNDAIAGNSKDIPLETLYGVEDEDEDEEIEEEEDEDYKKKVMIGTSYQASIPVGLSQYGDILPYENEDKLIWEPSQVSEREVEAYLIKIRDIKSNQQTEDDDEDSTTESNLGSHLKESGRSESNIDNLENNSFLANGDKLKFEATTNSLDVASQSVVKDNEQALHLLVQCGYDFKEALRRKRLNALPLNDCMSLWSEEECHKFEEGIQKYGKDFLKIRQNQVRTRTMRELVQFYYLWKKSERRDHNFANADTVDHMDIYLNEDNEYGSNSTSVITPVGSPVGNITNSTSIRRNSNASQKNISIMTTNLTNNSIPVTSDKNPSGTSPQQHHHKKRAHSSIAAGDCSHENSATILTNSVAK